MKFLQNMSKQWVANDVGSIKSISLTKWMSDKLARSLLETLHFIFALRYLCLISWDQAVSFDVYLTD